MAAFMFSVHISVNIETGSSQRYFLFWGGGGQAMIKAAGACSSEGTREISRNQGSELSSAMVVPQETVW